MKPNKYNPNKASGMALVEVMVALGIVGLIGLTVGQVMNQSMMLANNVKNKQAQMDDSNLVRLLISNPSMCKEAFRSSDNEVVTYNGESQKGTTDAASKIQRIVGTDGTHLTTFIEQGLNREDVKYTDIYFAAQTGENEQVRSDGKTYKSRITSLVLESTNTKVLMGGNRSDKISIPVNIITGPDDNDTIVDCSSFMQPDASCIALGGVYDSTQSPPCLLPTLAVTDSFQDRKANGIAGGFYTKGNMRTMSNLSVDGNTTLVGATNVEGPAVLRSTASVTGALTGSTAEFSSSLKSQNLAITGPSVFEGLLKANNAELDSNLTVKGTTSFTKDVTASGNLLVAKNLGIGNTSPKEALDVTGKIMSRVTLADGDNKFVVTNKDYVDRLSFANKGTCSAAGQFMKGFDSSGNRVCGTSDSSVGKCASGTYMVGVTSSGDSICQPVSSIGSCGSNQAMVGVSTSGQAICGSMQSGPKGEKGEKGDKGNKGDDGLGLDAGSCTSGQYMAGIRANGTIICRDLPTAAPTVLSGVAPVAAKDNGTYTVTFSTRFSKAPHVVVQPKWARYTGDEDTTWWVTNVTTSGFKMNWRGPGSGSNDGEKGVYWIAIEP